jgi:pimeloyl-ACP methyl ester carboxylesterase
MRNEATVADRPTGLITAGLGSVLVGGGYAALKWFAGSDRRRTGVDRDRLANAMDELAEPLGTRHHMIAAHDNGQLHAVEFGPSDAPTLVLLHGVTISAALYNHALVDLGNEFRVIAMDWRGHGRSRPGRDGYGLNVLAKDLVTLLEHLDLANAVVLGHSMGGMALGRFAVDHTDVREKRVSGLVFCDTAAFDVGRGGPTFGREFLRRFASDRPSLVGRLAQAPSGDLAYLFARNAFGDDPDPVAVEQMRFLFDAMSPSAITGSILPLFDHDVRAGLPSVTTRSLVMVGSKDPLTPPSQANDLVALLPNAALHTFEGAGHLPMLERRADFAKVLATFAKSVQ